jgi:hypothetical protein
LIFIAGGVKSLLLNYLFKRIDMKRQKKNKNINLEKTEVIMTLEVKPEIESEKITDELLKEKENQIEFINQELDQVRIELEKVKCEIEENKKELEFQVKNQMKSKREISLEEQNIIDKQVTNINKNNSSKQLIEKQKSYDNVKVTGRFMNRRAHGKSVKLTYLKYDDDPIKWYEFMDGKVYTIPRGFVDQINEYYHTAIFTEKNSKEMILSEEVGENSSIAEVNRDNKKYAFVPIGFVA